MINLAIEGTTRRIGKSQGFKGIAIRDYNDPDIGPIMTTAWEFTPSEIEQIVNGAKLHLSILGSAHPPILLEIIPQKEQTNA